MCEYLKELIQARSVSLYILDPKIGRFRFHKGTGDIDKKHAGGYLEISGEVLQPVEDYGFKTVSNCEVVLETENTLFDFTESLLIVMPIKVSSAVKGLWLCEHDEPVEINETVRVELIRLFLTQASLLVEFFFEYEHFEEKTKSLQLLYEIGNSLNTIRDEDELLESILMLVEKYMHVDRCSLMIMDPEGKVMRIKKAFGMPDVDIKKIKVTVGEGIAGFVAASGRPLLIKDLDAEPHLKSQVTHKKVFRTNSLVSIPLQTQGNVIGVINVNNRKDGRCFSEADLDLLSKIGSEIAAVLQRSYMASQLQKARELDRDIQRFMV